MNPEEILKQCSLPPMPQVASKILGLVNDPLSSVDDIVKTMSADQALTSRLIKLSNSSLYAGRRSVTSIADAVMTLGLNTVKNLAIAISTKELYKKNGVIEKKLWEHSIGVSIASNIIGKTQKLYKVNPELCVVVGLLHDIGKSVINLNYPDQFSKVFKKVNEQGIPYYEAEKEEFGFSHDEIGALLFEHWEFPVETIEIVRNHHNRELTESDENVFSICTIIMLANCICRKLGIGYLKPSSDQCINEAKILEKLGITPDILAEIIKEFKKSFLQEKMAFSS